MYVGSSMGYSQWHLRKLSVNLYLLSLCTVFLRIAHLLAMDGVEYVSGLESILLIIMC